MTLRILSAACVVALAAACSPLTADAPLFTPADQDPALTLAEGLWVAKEADCRTNPRWSRPERETCLDWARVTRAPDGAWMITDPTDATADASRVIFAAAAPRGDHRLAPLYVGEVVTVGSGEIHYGAVVPRGDLSGPVQRMAIAAVSCSVITDDAPIDGIVVTREEGKSAVCVAHTQAAVREATRRAVIEALGDLDDGELVFVRK